MCKSAKANSSFSLSGMLVPSEDSCSYSGQNNFQRKKSRSSFIVSVSLAVAGLIAIMPLQARADVTIDQWSCGDVYGTFTGPTTLVIDCYFQDEQGEQFPAHVIDNDPDAGQWHAWDFRVLPPGTYYLYAVGDDGSVAVVGPIDCP
jgi:hypothetical protein